ncbi:Uncharacterised protein [Serratia ficaria]|uniref:hypothetical protein n=2 Tax=Serratia ficaria TaxID=61651 RepID=UPI00217A133E|nr:hypothetical protein [Serratia ficaria]CAI0808633.1 Uncharacterised protein [Serratia ficaria]CAI1008653.1 Uncharacterised protein [Serratia ficaria]CAI1679698.1 Uncharacterised protein [Serratia ficaria]CAI2412322.1 Uncharacterised protein [Serratia ficaria]CAI2422219.1 Uncharacterised protein [Serratia ficaria]
MKLIIWDVAHFNISMKNKYNDIYNLENDISKLLGSSNFSEMDSLDWFLIDKKTKELSFILLSVPSFFNVLHEGDLINANSLHDIKLADCIDKFLSNVTIQDTAFFSADSNSLIVTSDMSRAAYKTLISDGLYFLLSDDFSYQGFILINATTHIPGSIESLDQKISNSFFSRMFDLCNQEFYDAMDVKDEHCLSIINKLENDCLTHQKIDDRLLHIIEFIKNIKYTFYDIDIE